MVFLLLVITGILINFLIALFVLLQSVTSRPNRAMTGLALSLSYWQLANYLADKTSSHTLYWNRATFIGPMFALYFAGLLIYFLQTTKKLTLHHYVLLLGTIVFSLYALTNQVISGVAPRYLDGQIVGYDVMRRGGYAIVIAWILYLMLDFVVGLLRTHIHANAKLRNQLNAVMLGIGSSLAIGLITNVVVPVLTNSTSAARFAPLTSIFVMGAFGFAIAKRGFLNIQFYVIRTAAYGMTLSIISVLFLGPSIFIISKIVGFDLSFITLVILTFVCLLLTTAYGLLRDMLNKMTARIFFRNQYIPEQFISELNSAAVSTLDLDTLLLNASKVIATNFRAEFCLFGLGKTSNAPQRILGTEKRNFRQSQIEIIKAATPHMNSKVIITSFIGDEYHEVRKILEENAVHVIARLVSNPEVGDGIGYIILGAKKSGQQYNSQDVRTLNTVIDGLIIAIQNAQRFEEIQNFNQTLQQRVDDATRKLRRTNAKLEALDETKDDFISMASHQLRTPLTAVKGYLSMVLDGDAGDISPMQRKMLNQAFISSQRMVFLIADLLNVSRLKTGKFVIERTNVNLAQMIEEEIGQLRETAASRNLKVDYEKPKDFPTLLLDETKTRQVVMNFIDNAIHYTPGGGHIRVELQDKPQTVELKVVDDGIGVPKSEQHHLFTKFYRANNARRERPDGTGLGLFMAKKVVVAQGGAVLFDSKENRGSTFGFTMPKAKLLAKAPSRPLATTSVN